MKSAGVILSSLLLASAAFAADEAPPAEKKTSMKDIVKARMLEDAKKAAAAAPAKAPGKAEPPAAEGPLAATAPAAPAASAAQAAPPKAAPEPATVLPKVEVRRERITILDQQIAKQEQDIAREKQNTKTTEMDRALNDPRVAKKLSILGGESAQHRATIASERVNLMEAEKDILEAMKLARTKAEKAELQKQLDEIRALRRDLEKSLR